MESRDLSSMLASGMQAASIASMDALKDDTKVRYAARYALGCAPFVVKSTIMATIGEQGFENVVLNLRDLVVAHLGNYRSDVGLEDITRGFNDVLARNISFERLAGAGARVAVAAAPSAGERMQAVPVKPSPVSPAPLPPVAVSPVVSPPAPPRPVGFAPHQPLPMPAWQSPPRLPSQHTGAPLVARKLSQIEVERLIADDATPDEVIAPYLRSVPSQRFPLVPVLEFDPVRVEIAPHRGLLELGLRALNDRTNRRRLSAWQSKVDGGWQGLRLLAEGDSWFLYPILLRDVIDNLSTDFAVYCVAEAGDTLYNMVRGIARLQKLLETHKFDGLVFSAGGNDIAGDQLAKYLRSHPLPARPAAEYMTGAYRDFLSSSQAQLRDLFTGLWSKAPSLRIFLHGYDWPAPRPQGAWLMPAMKARTIPDSCQAAILKMMIDDYYEMLFQLEREFPDKIKVVDCRGLAGAPESWHDELHPANSGFVRVADKFRQVICATFGLPYESRQQATVSLSWRPGASNARGTGEAFALVPGVTSTVGRGQDCDIRLDDSRVSRQHATFTLKDEGVEIEDTNSTNGTFLDGRKISRAVWRPGQRLQIGSFLFEMNVVAAAPVVTFMPELREVMPARPPFEIDFCNENLTAQPHESWAIGLFESVNAFAARGAARAIDEFLSGGLWDALNDRAVEAGPGRVTLVPLVDANGRKRNLLLLGLGSLSEFSPDVVQMLGLSLARTLAENHIAEVATVPIGGNSGLSADMAANAFLLGFVRGVKDFDRSGIVKKITVCELDPERYIKLVAGAGNLREAEAIKAAGIKVNVASVGSGRATSEAAESGQAHQRQRTNKIYLEVCSNNGSEYDYTMLGVPGAAIPPRVSMSLELAPDIVSTLEASCCPSFDNKMGQAFADTLIPPSLQVAIEQQFGTGGEHLVVIHDSYGASLPWEATMIDSRALAVEPGLSRQYRRPSQKRNVSAPPRRKADNAGCLRMLLAFDPTCNLKGATQEASSLQKLFAEADCEVTTLSREDCTKDAVLEALATKEFDILHFAGHGKFTEANPQTSGIILAGSTYLSASDLETLPAVPRLIFLNACQSGRISSAEAEPGRTDHASLAEAFILRNVMQFIGTYWLVDDTAAQTFSLCFYEQLMHGNSIGEAVIAARKALRNQNLSDWANYMHFGDPSEQLRRVQT